MKTRFVSEWCEKQFHDEQGEWVPDRDLYSFSIHPSLMHAKKYAIKQAKKFGIEWARVSEEDFNSDLDIPASSDAAWDVINSWSWLGDNDWELTT